MTIAVMQDRSVLLEETMSDNQTDTEWNLERIADTLSAIRDALESIALSQAERWPTRAATQVENNRFRRDCGVPEIPIRDEKEKV